jgi:hypothetical protein
MIEAEPGKPVEDRRDRLFGRARPIGVLDAQAEAAAAMPGVEIVEERGAGAADMEEAGRRGGETDGDGHGRCVAQEEEAGRLAARDGSGQPTTHRPC